MGYGTYNFKVYFSKPQCLKILLILSELYINIITFLALMYQLSHLQEQHANYGTFVESTNCFTYSQFLKLFQGVSFMKAHDKYVYFNMNKYVEIRQ